MSDANDNPHDALAAGRKATSTLADIKIHLDRNLSQHDLESIDRAIVRAISALDHRSVVSAIKDEDAAHITGRMALVLAQLEALYVTSEYLMQLAERLRADSSALTDAVERPGDGDL